MSFEPSSNFFSSAKRKLKILYVFGRKASDGARKAVVVVSCYRLH